MNWKRILLTGLCGLSLWGCDFLWNNQSTVPFVPKPTQLNPESDAFTTASLRSYAWTEGWKSGSKDTSVLPRTFQAQKTSSVHFSATDGYALPAAVVTHLGFNPAVLNYDNSNVPEPGPALQFPVTPIIGWRDTLTSGDLHFVRELTGLDTLRTSAGNTECWAFAETTYWSGAAVATGKYSMGRNGLVDLYEQRPNFNTGNDSTTVTLWREVKAQ